MDDEHNGITKNENGVTESAENDTDCITWKRPLENEMVVSLDEFMLQNKTNSFRVSRRRHTWTPLEQEKKCVDQDEYDEPEQVIFTRAIPLPNGDVMLEGVNVSDDEPDEYEQALEHPVIVSYYLLSECEIFRFPDHDKQSYWDKRSNDPY